MAYVADIFDKEHPILRQLDDLSSSHGRDQKLGRFAAPEIRTDDVSLCDVWHRHPVSKSADMLTIWS